MASIDEVVLNFSPESLNILNVILALIIFGVSLSIKLSDFKVLFSTPKPFLVGIISQFLLFPAITFVTVYFLNPPPSVALGMILVAACPGGNTSNFMTQFGRGNAALSIAMSAFSTALATIMTPFNINFWGHKLEGTDQLMNQIVMDPLQMFYLIATLMLIPLALGIFTTHKFPAFAAKIQRFMKIFSLTFFAAFIIFGVFINLKYIDYLFSIATLLVIGLNTVAYLIGYGFSYALGLKEYNRRAVSIETGIQNSGLGLVLIFNFFDGLGGMAIVAAFWGVWHLISGMAISFYWSKKPIKKVPA